MDSYNQDSAADLISAEMLNSFSIVERFCEFCGDITSHHIVEANSYHQENESNLLVPPISSHECVLCREQEEMNLDVGMF